MIRFYFKYVLHIGFSWTIFCAAYLPANNLRRIPTIYVRGYLQGNENGRVVTIVMQSFPSYTCCKVSICFSFKGKVISSFSLAILILSSIFSWTIFLCGLSSGKQFKKNFYHLLTRLLEG